MRSAFTLAAVATLLLPGGAGTQERNKTAHLQGKWACVRIETRDGVRHTHRGLFNLEIDQGQFNYYDAKGSSSKAAVKIDPAANPPRIDLYSPLTGTWRKGIYRFDADTLVICFWDAPADPEATFDLSRQKHPGTVYTLRRDTEPLPVINGG